MYVNSHLQSYIYTYVRSIADCSHVYLRIHTYNTEMFTYIHKLQYLAKMSLAKFCLITIYYEINKLRKKLSNTFTGYELITNSKIVKEIRQINGECIHDNYKLHNMYNKK